MKAKIKATGELIEVTETAYQDLGGRYFDCPKHKCYFREDMIDFLPEKETAVLEGWAARDANGELNIFYHKPERVNDLSVQGWLSIDGYLPLDRSLFPSVTWQSEPKRVRIKIEEIDE